MAKRKPLKKGVRFEVFKRDKFCCQYCGRTPPSVTLEVDHVVPVASGGDNSEINLITACKDCNQGKSSGSLEEVRPSTADQVAEMAERRLQIEAFNEFLMAERSRHAEIVEGIGLYWFNRFKRVKDRYTLGESRKPTINTFLKSLAPAEILEAIDIAHGRHPVS